jgi:hypothetical protein
LASGAPWCGQGWVPPYRGDTRVTSGTANTAPRSPRSGRRERQSRPAHGVALTAAMTGTGQWSTRRGLPKISAGRPARPSCPRAPSGRRHAEGLVARAGEDTARVVSHVKASKQCRRSAHRGVHGVQRLGGGSSAVTM